MGLFHWLFEVHYEGLRGESIVGELGGGVATDSSKLYQETDDLHDNSKGSF